MGFAHHKAKCPHHCRPRRPRPRLCLRKGCGRRYRPQRWNQRYCQDDECLRLVRRWQARRRQSERRQDNVVKAEHAAAERARRERAAVPPQAPPEPVVAAARGHAAEIFPATPVCARPGCFAPPLKSGRSQASYCCQACREAVRRVMDREHKWLWRGTFQGRCARKAEYQAARAGRRPGQHDVANAIPPRAPPA